MQEEFRKINEFPNYSVSNTGKVRNDKTGKMMQQNIGTTGYYYLSLSDRGSRRKYKIHRLVAQVFIPNPENKPCVDHIDNNPLNNNIDNLRWATISENMRNSKVPMTNKSGYKGVSFDKSRNKWRATIKNGKAITIGRYDTKEEAIVARQRLSEQIYGEYRNSCEKIVINLNIENVIIN